MNQSSIFRLSAVSLILGAAVLLSIPEARADLIRDPNIVISGTGLGNVNTLLTVLDQGAQGNGIQSGCINQNGSFSPCILGVQGGDNQAINSPLTFENNSSFAAVVNINETGQDLSVTLTHLYLMFVGPNGVHTAVYAGPPTVLTQGTGTGIGQSGFVFRLDALQAAAVASLGSSVTVSGGVQFAEGSTSAGIDTVFVTQIPAPTSVPEPFSVLLIGSGLVGLGVFRRYRAS